MQNPCGQCPDGEACTCSEGTAAPSTCQDCGGRLVAITGSMGGCSPFRCRNVNWLHSRIATLTTDLEQAKFKAWAYAMAHAEIAVFHRHLYHGWPAQEGE